MAHARSEDEVSPLRQWRLEQRLGMDDVANRLGVSVAQLSRIETGQFVRLAPEFVERVAKLTRGVITYESLVAARK